MRTRDKLLAELNELSRTKRMGSAEEQAKSDCDGLQSQLAMVQDEIVSPPPLYKKSTRQTSHLFPFRKSLNKSSRISTARSKTSKKTR